VAVLAGDVAVLAGDVAVFATCPALISSGRWIVFRGGFPTEIGGRYPVNAFEVTREMATINEAGLIQDCFYR